ncbi:MAG: IS91 family transposase [Bacteroidaceae bacterium]|nr:IS91 family transposase [Bacteroidaceae bacterium]
MARNHLEIASVIKRYGAEFRMQCSPNNYQLTILNALQQCRTAELGGHKDKCDSCGEEQYSYNSCGNRHCPKCQIARQMLWAEDRMRDSLGVKHFHIVFTVPDELNPICMADSLFFYESLFACAKETLCAFGYSHYGVETGAISVLHTWGQNLNLHPHLHCIVPAVGITPRGQLKEIGSQGKYLYPVRQLSVTFRGKLLEALKRNLKKKNRLPEFQSVIDHCYAKPWVVYTEPSLGNARQVVNYLAKYTHRVAISNSRIKNMDSNGVTFSYKDYADNANQKLMTLTGVEFLRRFAMHILPRGFVKIRYFGILTSAYREQVKSLKTKPDIFQLTETRQQRLVRLTGFDPCKCPKCKTGTLHPVELLPRVRSPDNVFYPRTMNLNQ